ncbi:hypothetical protein B2J88_47335 [Rhodococcus sp. SRB_17]|nr:hypothetical protein [Rhodococcus sp. SRB_17]
MSVARENGTAWTLVEALCRVSSDTDRASTAFSVTIRTLRCTEMSRPHRSSIDGGTVFSPTPKSSLTNAEFSGHRFGDVEATRAAAPSEEITHA